MEFFSLAVTNIIARQVQCMFSFNRKWDIEMQVKSKIKLMNAVAFIIV